MIRKINGMYHLIHLAILALDMDMQLLHLKRKEIAYVKDAHAFHDEFSSLRNSCVFVAVVVFVAVAVVAFVAFVAAVTFGAIVAFGVFLAFVSFVEFVEFVEFVAVVDTSRGPDGGGALSHAPRDAKMSSSAAPGSAPSRAPRTGTA